jgi:hypothetical protein
MNEIQSFAEAMHLDFSKFAIRTLTPKRRCYRFQLAKL